MKKHSDRIRLSTETLRVLAGSQLVNVYGGLPAQTYNIPCTATIATVGTDGPNSCMTNSSACTFSSC